MSEAVDSIRIQEHENLAHRLGSRVIDLPQGTLLPRPRAKGTKPYVFDLASDGTVGYFIGIDWLVEHKLAVEVAPKIDDLDYMGMFSTCLADPGVRSHLGKIYFVDWDKPLIPVLRPRHDFNTMVAVHFLILLRKLVTKPLKKGYVIRNENLQSRVKGRINLASHLTTNVLGVRPDRVFCSYQEYSEDCVENRLLRSGLLAAKCYLQLQNYALPEDLRRFIPLAEARFADIGLIANPSEVDRVRLHPLFPEYGEALRLAKMLFRKFGYHAETEGASRLSVPPFVIDMSLLFELYCLHHLCKVSAIPPDYQVVVNSGICDFLDVPKRTILDAKYKPYYDRPRATILEDIRQLSGYARDEKVYARFGTDVNTVFRCVIVYPSPFAPSNLVGWDDPARLLPMKKYRDFYKLGLKLPLKVESQAQVRRFADIDAEIEELVN